MMRHIFADFRTWVWIAAAVCAALITAAVCSDGQPRR